MLPVNGRARRAKTTLRFMALASISRHPGKIDALSNGGWKEFTQFVQETPENSVNGTGLGTQIAIVRAAGTG
jgi:hypothetical protein